MQVILMEKVANLGNLGDIVRVKDGFARNFLIPQRKAKRATDANRAEFEARRVELEKVAGERLSAAQALATKLDGLMVQITEKAGVDGRLFGSVTNFNISDALVKLGHDVERSQIRMPACRPPCSSAPGRSCRPSSATTPSACARPSW